MVLELRSGIGAVGVGVVVADWCWSCGLALELWIGAGVPDWCWSCGVVLELRVVGLERGVVALERGVVALECGESGAAREKHVR